MSPVSSRKTYDGFVEIDPAERLGVYHNFANDMESGEYIESAEIAIVRLNGARDVTSLVLMSVDPRVPSATEVCYGFDGTKAEDGEFYVVEVLGATIKPNGLGQRLKAKHLFEVRTR